MDKAYTCDCGKKLWIIDNQGIICHDCGKKYPVLYKDDTKSSLPQDLFVSPEQFNKSRESIGELTKKEIEGLLN